MESAECHFGKLSPELRNEVYSHLLPENEIIPVVPPVKIYWPTRFNGVQPPMTKVCRQVRSETKPMLYGNNKFVLPLNCREWDVDHELNGELLDSFLRNSVAMATAWLTCNPVGKSPLKALLVITVDLGSSHWEDHYTPYDSEPWEKLAEALRENGYSKEDYVIEAFVDQRRHKPLPVGGQGRNKRVAKGKAKIERGFRELGLRCEIVHRDDSRVWWYRTA